MNIKKTAAHSSVELLEEIIENFMNKTNFDDLIRMEFLEQSAKYMGVYLEPKPTDLLEDRILN